MSSQFTIFLSEIEFSHSVKKHCVPSGIYPIFSLIPRHHSIIHEVSPDGTVVIVCSADNFVYLFFLVNLSNLEILRDEFFKHNPPWWANAFPPEIVQARFFRSPAYA